MRTIRHSSTPLLFGLLTAALVASVGACEGSNDAAGPKYMAMDDADAGPDGATMMTGNGYPFEPIGPASYVPKVKMLLTGLAATQDEVAAVTQDPAALRGLIDQWMTLPEFEGRMTEFLLNAFQQNQVVLQSLMDSLKLNFSVNGVLTNQIQRNIMDSFPMTVMALVKSGQPLTAALGTNQYMMTTGLMSLMSYADDMAVNDKGQTTNRLQVRTALPKFTIDPNSTATMAQSLDPADPNYMIWGIPAATLFPTCTTLTPVTLTDQSLYTNLFSFLLGRAPYAPCVGNTNQQNMPPQFADTDWNDWRLVTLHTTDAGTPNTTPAFYDVLKIRAAHDLTIHTPRIGFFGTLAFDANWGTNATNEGRVTANQSLIVAIGQSIDGEGTLVPFPVNTADANHASNPACQGCHSKLDPYKQFFRQSYSLYYHDQPDLTQLTQPANFNIDGVTASGQGVGDLAKTLASHPRFPLAWTLKMHFWANSTAAMENDPEVLRVAQAFQDSKFDLKTLVRELFSSPLITFASGTKTTQTQGVIFSIARRDQYCASLSNRLGLTDVCGMTTVKPTNVQATVGARATLMPVDTYYRAYALPSYPTDPDLFFRNSTEAMCRLIADQVIDVKAPATSRYMSTSADAAIADFVSTVMGLNAGDPRNAPAAAILKDNFTASVTSGSNPTDSLKATFTLACIAPSSVIVGL